MDLDNQCAAAAVRVLMSQWYSDKESLLELKDVQLVRNRDLNRADLPDQIKVCIGEEFGQPASPLSCKKWIILRPKHSRANSWVVRCHHETINLVLLLRCDGLRYATANIVSGNYRVLQTV